MSNKSIGSLPITQDRHIRKKAEEHTLSKGSFTDLRSPGLFAKWPIIGLLMFLLGGLTFGALAYNVSTNSTLIQWDLATAKMLHAAGQNIPSALVEYVIFGFFVGREIIIIMGTILAIYFLHKHFWREFAMVLLGPGVGGLIILFSGYSRIFQGNHYLTDVLGGYALGIAWAGLVYTLMENLFRKG